MSINIDTQRFSTTRDGYVYRIIATDLNGELPVAILVEDQIYRLNSNLECPDDEGKSLAEARREHTRFFNVYRAADGAFVLGSKAFQNNYARTESRDAQRAIAGVRISFNENTRDFSATAV